jgi:hypothetical protein
MIITNPEVIPTPELPAIEGWESAMTNYFAGTVGVIRVDNAL